jgi:isoleucyl-tRNA synthetase
MAATQVKDTAAKAKASKAETVKVGAANAETPRQMEERIASFWKENDIYRKTKGQRKKQNARKWFWLDGPPYATGSIHVGTAMNKVLKDFYIRYFRMAGHDVWDQPGYDTHGLPIENKVEKLLGFKSKKDIEEYGVEAFVGKCKEFATEFIGVMGEQFKNLGVWMDWERPYMTLSNEYIEGAWYTFKKAYEKGLLFRGSYSVHVCPRCETAVAYNEIEYKEVEDNSIFVKFKVEGKKDEYLAIWTTTPWTLPSNTGVMANPKADYAKVAVDGGKYSIIVANALVEPLMKRFGIEKYKVVETMKGKKLEGLRYEHPLADMFGFQRGEGMKDAHRVVMSDQFVTLDEGTGLVHTAPGHGAEDYAVGKENNLPVINPLTMGGKFDERSGKYAGIFAKTADKMIIEDLRQRVAVLAEMKLKHDYPMCWRCDSPLLMMAVPQWFFKVTQIREELLEKNAKMNWVPDWAGQRFKNWLESLGDWPISRQRYWGTPLPIWVCDNSKCSEITVIGSRDELPKDQVPKDFHKPHIDNVFWGCKKCKTGIMRRVPDVLDVWFDSGVAAWASLGYPRDKTTFKKWWPVDFVLEGPDQIRGWWNSSMIASVMTFDHSPYDNVLFHGFVLDAHGIKMSKSKGNITTTEECIEKHGRDALRFYYLSRQVWDDMYFKPSELSDISKAFIVVANTFNFVRTYVPSVPREKPARLNVEDKWLLSRLSSVIAEATEQNGKFVSQKAANAILEFALSDLSRWYIKIIRDRVWPEYEGKDKEAAYWTLFTAAQALDRMLAPYCPYMAEEFYQKTLAPLMKKSDVLESVHMEDWPASDKKAIDKDLEAQMEVAKQIVEAASAARNEAGIKLRWPVGSIVVMSAKKEVADSVKATGSVLLSMCNSKKIEVRTKDLKDEDKYAKAEFSHGSVLVEKEMGEDLLQESLLRELVRKVQDMRKKAGLSVADRIELQVNADSSTEKFLKSVEKELKKEVGAIGIVFGGAGEVNNEKLEFRSVTVGISLKVK